MNQQQLMKLSKIKMLIKTNKKRFEIRPDRDYLQELFELGITESEAWKEILNLNAYFYVNDYRPYYSSGGESLIFKKNINGNIAYIKIKIEDNMAVCLSFHKDELKGE